MSELRTIEIDFDVHKVIELERTSFSESPNEVLRRLLKIKGRSPSKLAEPVKGRSWSSKGVTLPHGTELRMAYNGRQYTGTIENGEWLVGSNRFKSPSAAAGAVAVTKEGKHTKLDGWIYWYAKRPSDLDWICIKTLRR